MVGDDPGPRNDGRAAQPCGARRQRPVDREDLSEDPVLRTCRRVEFEGLPAPTVGRNALLARIGGGGMGVVFFGVNPRTEREVAIKVLYSSHLTDHDGLVARFFREARLTAQLRSRHLVDVLDVDVDEPSGNHFLVMEYVRGRSAGAWLRASGAVGSRGVPETGALEVVLAATRGLAVAHTAGIVHRDLKPDNILIPQDAEGELALRLSKLADLGLARAETGERSLTGTEFLLGTPGYIAPEQAMNAKRAGKTADVFGMGATLHALLCGKAPFAAPTPIQSLQRTMNEPHAPVRQERADVSPATAALIDVCLAKDPAERYPDAPALLEALERCLDGAGGGGPAAKTALVSAPSPQSTTWLDSAAAGDPVTAVEGGPAPPRTVGGGTTLSEAPSAAPEQGLRVTSRPAGASVVVDGRDCGTTPCLVPGLAAGPHRLQVSLAHHAPFEIRAAAVRAATVTALHAELRRASGSVAIEGGREGEPAKAYAFTLDAQGHLPATACEAGAYAVTVTLRGHETFTDHAEVEAGRTATIRVELRATAAGASAADAPTTVLTARPDFTDVLRLLTDLGAWDEATGGARRETAARVESWEPSFRFLRLQTYSCGGRTHEVARFLHEPSGMEFSLVPGESFAMGSPASEKGRDADERQHAVCLSRAFLVAATPVTQSVYERITRSNPSKFRGPELPVEQVSWADAGAFCARAGLSLPTEAQWEHACRAGTPGRFCCGEDAAALADHAWFADNSGSVTHPVGAKRPNALGLHDMHGNVWEWCADGYGEYCAEPVKDPEGAPRSAVRVVRGGSHSVALRLVRSAARYWNPPSSQFAGLGFRPVRVIRGE